MRIRDLGKLDGPVVLFGGPYSNLPALEAMMVVANGMAIPPEHRICTGDVVAYGAQPVECVALVRAIGCPVVAGNCERQLAESAPNCGCGFESGSTCDVLSAGWYAQADAWVGTQDRLWMGRLPDMAVFTQAGRRFVVIHGGVSDVSRFLWPSSPEDEFMQEIELVRAWVGPFDGVISGHCGLDFIREVGGVVWVNAGVIGMPPNDGSPQTRYGVLENGSARIERLTYDYMAAQSAMRVAGLVQGYDAALASGYWPSEDVLPPDLRRASDFANG